MTGPFARVKAKTVGGRGNVSEKDVSKCRESALETLQIEKATQ
jgi:hypothetical protein